MKLFVERDVSKTMFKREKEKIVQEKLHCKVGREILQKLANSFCGKCARNSISVVL